MNAASPVVFDVCLAFLTRFLSGFRGYPYTQDGRDRVAEILQSAVVSVEHLEAVLRAFDEEFPTVRQINDVAANLRPKFEVKPDQYAEWKRQFGAPVPMRVAVDAMAMHWQAIRDALYYVEGPGDSKSPGFWQAALLEDEKQHADTVAFVREQARRLGWPETMKYNSSSDPVPFTEPLWRRQEREERRRRGSDRGLALLAGPPPGGLITQGETDASRKSTADVDRELDAWDDPDR